jgi:hypothetical protein
MPTGQLNFARNLKITRFMIDVLMQRLQDLRPHPYHSREECEGLVGWAYERVAACDQLHNELHERFSAIRPLDADAIVSLSAEFEELRRKLAEPISRLNTFEYWGAGEF